jgi:hypothetical protein
VGPSLNRRLCGSHKRSGHCGGKNRSLSGIERRFLGHRDGGLFTDLCSCHKNVKSVRECEHADERITNLTAVQPVASVCGTLDISLVQKESVTTGKIQSTSSGQQSTARSYLVHQEKRNN